MVNGELLGKAWELREGPAVLATVDKDSTPNSVYVLCVELLADGRIAIMDNYFSKTRENIRNGSKGSLLFLTKAGKSYQAKGSIEYSTAGPLYEDMKKLVDPKHPRVGAAVLCVEELYSGAERIGRYR